MIKIDYPKLILSIVICQIAGVLGSIFTSPNIQGWYVGLNKPWFTPPNWLFGPVWISLYTLIGISLYLVWQKGLLKDRMALGIFVVQLGLNALWSFLFFGLRSPLLGLVGIIPLWIFIALNIWAFWRIEKKAGYMLVPYICWVSIATALNYYVLVLNP
jgi:benzodiazapine receptor